MDSQHWGAMGDAAAALSQLQNGSHRRFQTWCQQEVLRAVLVSLANELRAQDKLDPSECFIDAMFASAKGGGERIGKTRRGKGVKIMGIVDKNGLPLAVTTHAANHHEVTLVQLTLDFYMIEAQPNKLIGDRAYRQRQTGCAVGARRHRKLIAPHKRNRRPDRITQDGRKLRRYQTPLAGGTLLGVAAMAPPIAGALGVLSR